MYLKSLELQGFKSFADKINLEFHDGVTAVVGPNGSGKSNISDAIRWVLGEQSAKTLRGSKMEDVIFTGTDHRRPLGFAEVTLLMDNTDRALALDYNEVSVTRRVYRSGESEYLLNNSHCRLKDVYELFLDTGVGRDGYSIIGQGRIDEILSSKSEDRRNVFEEASGIMKYKVKKNEAERKLEHITQNLLRIGDIITELESQLEPLEQQAETAKRFLILRDELKDIEVSLFLQNMDRANERISEFILNLQIQKVAIDSENEQLDKITLDNQVKTEASRKLEVDLEGSRKYSYEIESEIERQKSEVKINEERITNINENMSRLELEIIELSQGIEKTSEIDQNRVKKIDYLNKQFNDYSAKLEKLETEYSLMLKNLNNSESEIESFTKLLTDTQDKISDKKLQAGSLKVQVESFFSRKGAIDLEIAQNKIEIDKEGMLSEDLSDSVIKSKKQFAAVVESINASELEKNEIQEKITKLSTQTEIIASELQYKQARIKMLKEMESNLEGFVRSVKEILKKAKVDSKFGEGIHGAFAQLIKVEKKYEVAIEMALGNTLQNIVTSKDVDAKRAIEYIKEMKLGRATFLPIDVIKGRRFDKLLLEKMSKMSGFVGVAADLVKCEQSYKEIAESLLGRVGVIDTFENARAVSRQFDNNVKLATLDGIIFNSGGSITGGHNESAESGLVSRNREIPQLETEIFDIKEAYNINSNAISSLSKQLSEVEKELSAKLNDKKNCEMVLIRDQTHLSQVNSVIDKLKAKNESLQLESTGIIEKMSSENLVSEGYTAEIVVLENEIIDLKNKIEILNLAYKEKSTNRQVFYEDITNIKLSLNSITESIAGVREAEELSTIEKASIAENIQKKQDGIEKLKLEVEKNSSKNSLLQEAILKNVQKKASVSDIIDAFTENKKQNDEEMYGIIEIINQKNRNIQMLQEDLGKIEIKKAKLEAELDIILDRLWNEYELTILTAESFRKEIPSVTSAQKRVNELKAQIRELGSINISAIDDFVKTKERFEFMKKQNDDLEQGKEKLQKVISEMVQIMRKRFSDQFKIINKHFGEVFKELFNGGSAELVISDQNNILESGIDIIVQPPGKKLQNMMLLSGGEKALTAISLLFAILKMKPTPFCILDEIESALDEANVNRFGSYLKDFARNTQFIIVTHRKGTMEISNSLYGVTMQEHGISKLVSLKLNEV
ncbi:MAG: chromosome segregation protein SMC [Bacillota bacterium]